MNNAELEGISDKIKIVRKAIDILSYEAGTGRGILEKQQNDKLKGYKVKVKNRKARLAAKLVKIENPIIKNILEKEGIQHVGTLSRSKANRYICNLSRDLRGELCGKISDKNGQAILKKMRAESGLTRRKK